MVKKKAVSKQKKTTAFLVTIFNVFLISKYFLFCPVSISKRQTGKSKRESKKKKIYSLKQQESEERK